MSIILNASTMEQTNSDTTPQESLAGLRQRALHLYEQKRTLDSLNIFEEYLHRTKFEVGQQHLWFVEANVVLINTLLTQKNSLAAIDQINSFKQVFQSSPGPDRCLISRWLNSLAEALFHHQHYELSHDICWFALDICQRHPVEQFDELTRTRNNLASVFIYLGQLKQAEELFRSNLTSLQQKYGSKHTLVATIMNNLGELCRQQFRFKDAETFLLEAHRIRKELLPSAHPLIDQSLNNIGFLRMNQGRYLSAEKAFSEALITDASNNHLVKTPQQLSSLVGLAETKIQLGYLKQAEELLEEGLALAEKILSSNNLRLGYISTLLATTYHRLNKDTLAAQTLQHAKSFFLEQQATLKPIYAPVLLLEAEMRFSQKNYQEAEFLLQQALKMQVQFMGHDHLEVTRTLQQLALVFTKLARESRSNSILKNILAVRTKLLGSQHPEIIHTHIMLARCSNMRKSYTQAHQHCTQADAVRQGLKEDLPYLRLLLQRQFAMSLRGQSRFAEAISHFQAELSIAEELFGNDAFYLVDILEYIASMEVETKQFAVSSTILKRCLKLIEKRYNAYHLDYADKSLKLAFVEYELKNYPYVVELFEKSLAIKKARLPKDDIKIIDLTKDMIRIFKLIGETDKAQKYQAELDFEEGKDHHVLSDLF